MNRLLDKERLKLGVCYYPEHWPKEMWREDLERMADVGIEVDPDRGICMDKNRTTRGQI